jgi:hypothetical protein
VGKSARLGNSKASERAVTVVIWRAAFLGARVYIVCVCVCECMWSALKGVKNRRGASQTKDCGHRAQKLQTECTDGKIK